MSKHFFIISSLIFALFVSESNAQWGAKFYGFVETNTYFDTRQNVSSREGINLLYPTNENIQYGEDINDGINFNILSLRTRAGANISVPDFLGAKSSAKIEADFVGSTSGSIGSLALRLAYLKLDWGMSEILAGQDWNPMYETDAAPKVLSYNTGRPFLAYSRSPQVRYTLKTSGLKFHLTAMSESSFLSQGPNGESSEYIRNAGLPILNFGTNYRDESLYFAANINYKQLKPRLMTSQLVKEDNTISGISANALARVNTNDFYFTISGLYGQSAYDLVLLGGYGVSSVSQIDSKWEYSSIDVASAWFDCAYGNNLKVGLFGGYTQNLGSEKEIIGSYYTRGADIDYVYRLSPRISYRMDNTQIGAEIEYTTAAYGTPNKFMKVENSKEISNVRVLLSANVFF